MAAAKTVASDSGASNVASGFSKMCRTCAACTDNLTPIFSGQGLLNNLADKIQRHLPIKVSERDLLPQQVCEQCASTLVAWHELVKCCTLADAAMRIRLQRLNQLNNEDSTASETENDVKTENLQEPEKWTEAKHVEYVRCLEAILLSYTDKTDDNSLNNIVYMCQKCDSPFNNIDELAMHLRRQHSAHAGDQMALASFITENLILVETLDENLPRDKLAVEPRERAEGTSDVPARVRVRRRRDSRLEKLCCPFCPKIFSARGRLVVHLNMHDEVSATPETGFRCHCCEERFEEASGLVTHLQREHVVMDVRAQQQPCRSCGHVADDDADLRRHVAECHASAPVPSLDRASARVPRANSRRVPVDCPRCDRRFSNKYNLRAHLVLHELGPGSRFECGACGRGYRSRGSLKFHEDTVHRGVLRHVCGACGEAFPSRMRRDLHARLHTGDSPYQCDSCDARFRSKNSLVTHVKSHLGLRKYACPRCPARFLKLAHLKYHTGSHNRKDMKSRQSNSTLTGSAS